MAPPAKRIAWREAALAATWALILGVVFSGVQVAADYRDTFAEEEETVVQLLQTLRHPAAQAAYNLSVPAASVVVDGLLAYQPIHEARLVDDFGEQLAGRTRQGALRGEDAWWRPFTPTTRVYELPLAVAGSARPVGRLEAIVDQGYRIERFLTGARRIVLLGLARNLALAAALVLAFHLTLTRPLTAVATAITRRRRGEPEPAAGILAVPEAARDDEIGAIARGFEAYAAEADARERTIAQTAAALTESEARYRDVVETTSEGVWVVDADGVTTLANDAMASMLGVRREELIGRRVFDFVDDGARAEVKHRLDRRRQGITERYEFRFRRVDGAELWAELAASPILDREGRYLGALAMVSDVGARHRQEAALRASNAELERTVARLERHRQSLELIAAMNVRLQATSAEQDARAIIADTGAKMFAPHSGSVNLVDAAGTLAPVATWGAANWRRPDVALTDCHAARAPAGRWSLRCTGRCAAVVADETRDVICLPLRVDETVVGVVNLVGNSPAAPELEDLERRVRLYGEIVQLGLANLRLREALREQAIRDPLTGLANRRLLDETLQRDTARSMRSGDRFVVAMIDIDNFKSCNDTHGHAAGDAVLCALAKILEREVRGGDLAARYGGEEFVCLMHDMTLDEAHLRFEVLRERIAGLRPTHLGVDLGPISVSIGLAEAPTHGITPEAILCSADEAMYRAKGAGRNCVRVAGSATPQDARTRFVHPAAAQNGGGRQATVAAPETAEIDGGPTRTDAQR
jgi:diguanylate cyclase (GGDEF)-like protein/PAS domain S-box-containing protein